MSKRITRRDFLKGTAAVGALAALPVSNYAFVAGSDRIRLGIIGCGGRGSGAVLDACGTTGVELVAMADIFHDRLESSREHLKEQLGEKFKVTEQKCFYGWHSYEYLLMSGVDYVICSTPPGFRPLHVMAAVEAGKHVFMEKPAATCPAGCRRIMEAAKLAESKGLGILAGTQYRHHRGYQDIVARMEKGEIGKIRTATMYYMVSGQWTRDRQPEWTDMEWQIRNWMWFTWLSGDQPLEQFVHNIDVMNWAMGGHPTKAVAMGGRQLTEVTYGNIFDHFEIEYEYPGGAIVNGHCRQWDNAYSRVLNRWVGTDGEAGTDGLNDPCGYVNGTKISGAVNPYYQEHADFIASLRAGKPFNEGVQVAESTLTAIMGRMSAYTGQEVTWEQALNSKLNLMHNAMECGKFGYDPVPTPGATALI